MKTNNNIKFRVASLLSALLMVPMISNAAINTGIDASAVINTGSGPNSSTSAETDSSIEITNTTIQSSSTELEIESDSEAELKLNTLGIAVVSATQVNSDADLEIFSENVTVRNKNVARVEVSSDNGKESEVIVVYKHRGKLMGFIPVTIRSTTEVVAEADADVAVKSRLSWWSFLVAKKNYNKAEIESGIRNNIVVKANAKVDASASAKARVAEAMIAEIQAYTLAQLAVNN